MTTKVDVNSSSRYTGKRASIDTPVVHVAPEEVPKIIEDLHNAFRTEKTWSAEWRKTQLRAFRRMLVEKEAELCKALFEDLGKSAIEGFLTEIGLVIGEIDTMLQNLDEWMKPVKKAVSPLNFPGWSSTQRDPLGVCLVLGAWNYPIQLSLCPMVGAIAGGNCVILKPGSYAHSCSNVLARLIPLYLDSDCVKVIEGDRTITAALLKEKTDMIFFTGSAFVGKIVARAAAEHLTPCVLELGGKSPCIVDRSADIDHAAKRIVWAKFLNAGQTCVACDFLLVHNDVAEDLLRAIKKYISEFYTKDSQKTEYYGRIVNEGAFSRLQRLVEGEKKRVVIGGQSDASDRFIEPTILDFGTDLKSFEKSEVMSDEIFGPIFPVCRYDDVEDVIVFIRELCTGKPLALYAYGSDSRFIETIKSRTRSGGLCINDSIMHLASHDLPFGGVGNSGLGGGYHGFYSFQQFTHEKAVLEKSQFLDNLPGIRFLLNVRFPPYPKLHQKLLRLFADHVVEQLFNLPLPSTQLLLKLALAYLLFRMLGFNVVRE